MSKKILITGATDGIGLETAKLLTELGHTIILHGRNPEKLENIKSQLTAKGDIESIVADLSDMKQVKSFAAEILNKHETLDVLINNAGVLKSATTRTVDGFDIRFAVNTIAPYLLTRELLSIMDKGRVVNLSSAAQASVNLSALMGKSRELDAMNAYSQSKLAITMWTRAIADKLENTKASNGPIVVAVNPGSLLASKMVKEGFGIAGNDLSIGANVIVKAALSDEFMHASGKYYDNDSESFAQPHADALDLEKCKTILQTIENLI